MTPGVARPLGEVRVVEIGATMAVAYAGRLLADLGAEVVKLEPAAGDRLRHRGPFLGSDPARPSAAAAYFHHGKQSVVVEDDEDPAAIVAAWCAGADVVLVDRDDPGMPVDLGPECDRIVVDLSTFGGGGPFAEDPPGELMALAASGMLSIVSTASNDPDPVPISVPGELSGMLAGCNAALVSVAALYDRDHEAPGVCGEVTRLESIASVLATAYGAVTYAGFVPVHDSVRAVQPWAIYECSDGELLIQCTEDAQWRALVDVLGSPDWGTLDVFATVAQRVEQFDAVQTLVAAAMADVEVGPFLAAARAAGVPCCPVHTAGEVVRWEQLREREFFRPVEVARDPAREVVVPSSPVCLDGRRLGASDRALPDPGQHGIDRRDARAPQPPAAGASGARRPLEGVRVLDLTWVWAGPFAAMQLAHLGAEVIKIESASRMDVTRILGPWADEEVGQDRSGYFNQLNQGKRSVALDLSGAAGRGVLAELIRSSDVVIDNMRAGALARMGFGQDRLDELNPRLVSVALTGFGETGPERDRQAYGSLIDAMSGINAVTGRPGGPPIEIPMSLPDPSSGLHAAVAVVGALRHARGTGRGCHVECSMIESWISTVPWGVLEIAATGHERERAGLRVDDAAPHGVFRCAGDYSWVAVAVRTDDEFGRLMKVIDQPELVDDPRFATLAQRKEHEDELESVVTVWTAGRTRDDAAAVLAAAGVPARPVRTMDEVVACPHLGHRGFAPALEHPVVGRRALPGVPWSVDRWPPGAAGPAPVFGADTDAVLSDIAGLSDEAIAELRSSGVLA